MSNETPEQRAEEKVNEYFGNSLTTEQHTLAVQIIKEIYYKADPEIMEFKALDLEEWRKRVSKFEQDFQTQLKQENNTPQQLSTLRFAILWLQTTSGEIAKNKFNESAEGLTHYEQGIKYTEDFINKGETDSKVREHVLSLYRNTGITYGEQGDLTKGLEYYKLGINHAEDFINKGETDSKVREEVLILYRNTGITYGEQGDLTKELEYYKLGINHAEDFINQGETDSKVREQVLSLYRNTGFTYGEQGDLTKGLEYYKFGINHAEDFINQGETDSKVREQVLSLYINTGITYGKQGDLTKKLEYYKLGINHAEDFINKGETDSKVREQVLGLYRNTGITYGEQGDLTKELEYCKLGINHAEDFINKGETDSKVREEVLKLYRNTGITYGEQGDLTKELENYKLGINHAEDFINKGETDSKVREEVLKLYDNYSSTYSNIGQEGQIIQLLPMQGLWSWMAFDQLDSKNKQTIQQNWQLYLEISHKPTNFTTAFHTLLRKIVVDYHSPQLSHRHFGFIPTQTLLAISEGLYAIERATDNQKLQTVYQSFAELATSPLIQEALELQEKQQNIQQSIKNLRNNWLHPLRHWWLKHKLQSNQENIQQLADIEIKTTNRKLIEWLKANIIKQFPTSNLESLAEIALGMLLASQCNQNEPETLLKEWKQSPPWPTTLKNAFAPTNWQQWIEKSNKPVYNWIDSLKNNTARRLKTVWEITRQPQPNLQKWLQELATDNPQPLAQQLDSAWNSAQITAKKLAPIFAALNDSDFHSDLFTNQNYTDVYYQQTLASVILGDVENQLELAIKNWLDQQIPTDQNEIEILNTFNVLKYKFTRASTLYNNPHYAKLEISVHNWAKTLLQEALQVEPVASEYYAFQQLENEPNYSIIWRILERTRIGLNSIKLHLEADWNEELGKELWKSLDISIKMLAKDHKPTEQEMWPPLATWLQTLEKWLDKPPSIEQCQQHLQPTEALIQPFFDPIQQQLRILWLDQQGIRLRELPKECADQNLWITDTKTGIINQWTRGIDNWKQELYRNRGTTTNIPNWEAILQSTTVTSFADTLQQWATELTQLTIIFPAPLGQLPWESLPQLENKLVREISIGHWYNNKSPNTESTIEVISDPSAEAQCAVKESRWVAKHFTTKPYIPQTPSIFDTLHKLANCQQAHLATHGFYNKDDPNSSYLTLNNNIKFPLWMTAAIRTKANLILLSACESNLNGKATEGLLTPVGIGPILAAAGAKTVVGTLWVCDGLAALCFSYHFYTIAQDNPKLAWHKIATQARKKLREMTNEDLKELADKVDLHTPSGDKCSFAAFDRENPTNETGKKPFQEYIHWAGFVVLG